MLDRKTLGIFVAGMLLCYAEPARAQVVPGTGQELTELNDNFEDPNWMFTLNLPKASVNIDKVDRQPSGFAANQMWFESTYRGTPDFVKRVETPEGGLPGSTGAMAMQTLYSGVPGTLSNKFQQDDLIANVSQKLGFMIPAAWTPSYTVRVYLPPFEQWEQRIGSTFGFRADCQTIIEKPTKMGRFFRTGGTSREMEQYWPGFFIQFNGKTHPQAQGQNSATILIRSGTRGEDVPGPLITKSGWWTLGMTITPDGQVHYYGHEGVANLSQRDHLYSNFPYGYKCLQTSTYFFNIVNQDDGRSWSTRWIIDDPKTFVASRPYTPQAPKVAAQPVSQTKPVQPPAAAAAPAALPTTPATPGTTPAAAAAAAPTVVAPAKPAVPAPVIPPAAVQSPSAAQTPAAQVPAIQSVPATLPVLRSAPAGDASAVVTPTNGGLPPLQGAVTPIAPKALPKLNPAPGGIRMKAPIAANTTPATSNSALPPLLNAPAQVKPMPVTPTKVGEGSQPAAPPALLPDDGPSETSAITSPVISTPAPAPLALPQDDAPTLPPAKPTTEPTPPLLLPPPQTPKADEPPAPLIPPPVVPQTPAPEAAPQTPAPAPAPTPAPVTEPIPAPAPAVNPETPATPSPPPLPPVPPVSE